MSREIPVFFSRLIGNILKRLMKPSSNSLHLIKKINRVKLLNLLRQKSPLSRTQLAIFSHLDNKTITNIIGELLKESLVKPIGFQASSGGRRGELLDINEDYAHIIGIDLGASHILGVLVNLKAKIIKKEKLEILPRKEGKNKIIKKVLKLCHNLLKTESPDKQIKGIGFVLPGILDREKGISKFSVNLMAWEKVPIKKILEKEFSLPVFLEESSRAMALAENWFGAGRNVDNFISLDLGIGIGMGIILGGKLYYGKTESAGEIGHTTVEEKGRRCHCGKYGCLETIASGLAIAQEAREQTHLNPPPITAQTVADAAKNNDKFSLEILAKAGKNLGIAVSNIINLFNPELLIIGGGLANSGKPLLVPMKEAIKKYTLPTLVQPTRIVVSKLGEESAALGAATLFLKGIFELEETKQ